MLKISIVEGPNQRRLVIEGKFLAPWVAGLMTVNVEGAGKRWMRI